jgi:hypothetical protein
MKQPTEKREWSRGDRENERATTGRRLRVFQAK